VGFFDGALNDSWGDFKVLHDWTIQARAECCDLTGRPFADGEPFFTLLYRDKHGVLHRRDVSEEGWRTLQQAGDPAEPPFSFWRSKFTAAAAAPPETLPKEDAESLLRRFLSEGRPEQARAAYILALMLERKRLLRPTDTQDAGPQGERLLMYEHARTGETFVVADPRLRLDQLEDVQREVAELLAGGTGKVAGLPLESVPDAADAPPPAS
jgi:hypothetical protein